MNNRKILTLEEVLNLNRRPTLQEMVDLSVEDYTKYLFEKGIIKYIPEDYDLWEYDYEEDNYYPENDMLLKLDEDYGKNEPDNCGGLRPEGFILNESEGWNDPRIIEKGVVYVNGKEVEYKINNINEDDTYWIDIYEKCSDGRYSCDSRIGYYLLDKK